VLKSIISRYCLIACLIILPAIIMAADTDSDLELTVVIGSDIIDGFTQYELQFLRVDSLLNLTGETAHSRLRCPFSAYLGGAQVKIEFRDFYGSLAYYKQYNENNSDPMQDWDWVTTADDSQLWAYGVTDPDPDLRYWQFDVGYEFINGKNKFRPFFRYTFYHSEFLMTGLEQITYYNFDTGEEYESPDTSLVLDSVSVLYYEQDLKIPFFGAEIESSVLGEKTLLSIELAYSPFTAVDDYDNHLIRTDSLEAWNSGDFGTTLHLKIGARINISSSLWINAAFAYEDYIINTEGTQTFIRDDERVRATGVNTEVRGIMRHFKLSMSYLFNL
jgi:hypothetical protein